MANQILYGFMALKDVFAERVEDVGVQIVNAAIDATVTEHNQQMANLTAPRRMRESGMASAGMALLYRRRMNLPDLEIQADQLPVVIAQIQPVFAGQRLVVRLQCPNNTGMRDDNGLIMLGTDFA